MAQEPRAPTPGFGDGGPGHDDPTVRTAPTKRDEARHRSLRHAEYLGGDDQSYGHEPEGDSMWERAASLASVAPIHGNSSLDPHNPDAGPQLAAMAGWNGAADVGHDALQGVSKYVTGESLEDPMDNLRLVTHHGRGALKLDPDESIMRDDAGAGHCSGSFNWCGEL
jgi:hypothetical protein